MNRSLALFSMGNDELFFTFNDGNLKDNVSFLEKLKSEAVDGIKFSTFDTYLYTIDSDAIRSMLGTNVELYINNELITSEYYTFPSSGLYTVEGRKTINGTQYKATNFCYVGLKNPYGKLTVNYSPSSQILTAKIENETTEKIATKWFLDNVLVSENDALSVAEMTTGIKTIKAVVTYKNATKTFESVVDLDNMIYNVIADLKQWGHAFDKSNSTDDLRLNVQFKKDNQTWKISPDNTAKLNVSKIEFYKKIDQKTFIF